MATPLLPRFLLVTLTPWTATAKLDLPPTLLSLMPLAVLLSLLARFTILTTLAALLVVSMEEQTATILAAVLLVCLHEVTIAREGTTLTRGLTLLVTVLPTLTLLARLLGECSHRPRVFAFKFDNLASDVQLI